MTIINRIFGWKDPIYKNIPKEPCVLVIGHSSYWDIFIIMIYIYCTGLKNIFCLVRPDLANWYAKPIQLLVNMIYAPNNNKKNNNAMHSIVEQFKSLPSGEENPRMLLLSPKGTIIKREWRSGFYYIAKELNVPIYPVFIDFSNREISFGNPINPNIYPLEDATKNLQSQLSKYRILNMESAEYPINDQHGCPYESFFPFDFCCISLLSFIPYLYTLLSLGYTYQFLFSLFSICLAWKYHLDKEGTIYPQYTKIYQKVESTTAYCCIGYHVISNLYYKGYLPNNFYVIFFMALFFYMNSIPRGCCQQRGKYAILHSVYHILAALTGYMLLCY